MNNLEALKVKPEVKPTNQGVKVILAPPIQEKKAIEEQIKSGFFVLLDLC